MFIFVQKLSIECRVNRMSGLGIHTVTHTHTHTHTYIYIYIPGWYW